ncbi:MAG: hypothetical protein KGY38_08455 [Desulfobacterales bacterium]|nr:hypothetical protein [Desulfobacterales bacterium]
MKLRKGAHVLSRDFFGDKVLRLRDGSMLKLFRVKRLFSSARVRPYSLRFVRNAEKLNQMNISSVRIII